MTIYELYAYTVYIVHWLPRNENQNSKFQRQARPTRQKKVVERKLMTAPLFMPFQLTQSIQ
jgi:hypothetical protein